MRKSALVFCLVLLVLISSGCIQETQSPIACTEDARVCPDGTSVVRIPPDCEFATCPTSPPSTAPSTTTPTTTHAPTTTALPTTTAQTTGGKKIVLVWIQEGVRKATLNGVPLKKGIDNQVEIDKPLQAIFDYTDVWGKDHTTTLDLQSYYDYFVIKTRGGWTSNRFKNAYESDKTST